jgi:SAM-dependent methyltransferase
MKILARAFGKTLKTERREPPKLAEEFPAAASQIDARIHVLGNSDVGPEMAHVRELMRARSGEVVDERLPPAEWARWGLALELIRGSKSVLDVGTGQGAFINALAKAAFTETLEGVDIRDYSMYSEFFPGFRRLIADAENLPYQDGAFETVVCMEVLEHLPDGKFDRVLSELRRIAAKRLLITVPFYESLPLYRGHFQRFDPARAIALFPRAQFTLLVKTPAHRVPWLMVDELRHEV